MRHLLSAGLCFCALGAYAEEVRVLSGEHEDFSRLVMVFSEPTTWSVQKNEKGYTVRFERRDIELALDKVFDLIPRDRIEAVSFNSQISELDISVDCICYIKPFQIPENTLVIDIVSGEADPEKPPEVSADKEKREQQILPFADAFLGAREQTFGVFAGSPPTEPAAPPVLEAITLGEPSVAEPSEMAVDVLETALIEQLGRASSQGLLTLEVPDDGSDVEVALSAGLQSADNLKSQTVFDRVRSELSQNHAGMRIDRCRLDPELRLEDRGADVVAADLIAEQRARLGDLVRDPTGIQKMEMAVTYLYLGFGAEARFTIQKPQEDRSELIRQIEAIAQIIDDGSAPAGGPFEGLTSCDDTTALWAILTGERTSELATVNTDAIQTAFFALPTHLKQQIAPALIRRLADIGLHDSSAAVQSSVTRSGSPIPSAISQAIAEQELVLGQGEEAQQRLEKLISENTEATPGALLALMRSKNEQSTPVPLETLALAEGIIYQQRGQLLANELQAELAVARAIRNDFSGAFNTFRPEDIKNSMLQKAREDVTLTLAEKAGDEEFLKLFFLEQIGNYRHDLTNDTLIALADRLRRLGVSDIAAELITNIPAETSPEVAILWASVNMDLDRPREALTAIIGNESTEAETIRADAMKALGRYEDAIKSYVAVGKNANAALLAWLHDLAPAIYDFGSDAERNFAQLVSTGQLNSALEVPDVATNEAFSPSFDIPITREVGRDTVARSRALREAAQALLEEKSASQLPD